MSNPPASSIFAAADIGNSRLKIALFERPFTGALPTPLRTCHLTIPSAEADQLIQWLRPSLADQIDWWISSVNRAAATELIDWLRVAGADTRLTLVGSADLPLEIDIERPDMVGIDRLLAAVAADRLRRAGHAAVVIDMGSAITVDLISPEGVFKGGAILPGIGLSARALHEFTDFLPLVDLSTLDEPPSPIATSTIEAMQSGLFWGAVGAVRELIGRIQADLRAEVDVFLTGGAAAGAAPHVHDGARYLPDLILAGIALAAEHS